MNCKKTGILSCLIKAPVLFFYIIFFIVEIFFNDGTGNISNNSLLLQKNTSVSHTTLCINKSDKGNDKKQTFHLNRRFQPKDVLSCNLVVLKVPAFYLERKIFVPKYDLFIPASDLLSQSYRGPPVVA